MPSDVDSRATEPIEFLLVENDAGVTGASLRYDVTRISGGVVQWLNRTTATFVGSVPADGDRYRTLTQVDATNAPGYYRDTAGGVNLATVVNKVTPTPGSPLIYRVTFYQTAPTVRLLDACDIVAGVTDGVMQQLTGREDLAANGTGVVYANDGVTVLGNYVVTDPSNNPITVPAGAPARRTAQT